MDRDDFSPSAVVKRKPVPSSFRHDWKLTGDIADHGSIPLLPIENSSTWSPPPPDYQHEDTSYDGTRHLLVADSPHKIPKAGFDFRNIGSRYSKLSSTTDQESERSSKLPAVFQYASPLDVKSQKPIRMWNSVWLHYLVLISFIVLFLALLAGLLVLWHIAKLQNGISTHITKNHYAWTYGPTALLVIITVAWKQVDYNCRILAPWKHLRAGPSSARSGLLLDYVSPILPHTLVIAATKRDWAVLASGMGILVLRVVIVFSTALLVLTPTTVFRSIDDAMVNSKFVGTNYTVETELKDDEVMRYYGIQKHGMNYDYGTTDTVAYETIDLQSVVQNSTVTTTVNGVLPYFDCEVVVPEIVTFKWEKATSWPWADTLKLNMTMSPEVCPRILLTAPNTCSPTLDGCPLEHYIYSTNSWNMPSYYISNYTEPVSYDYLNPCNNYFVASVTEFYFKKLDGHPVNSSAAWNVTLTRTTGVVCKIGYSVNTFNVTINTWDPTSPGNVNVTGPIAKVADVLPGYSYDNFTHDYQQQESVFGLQASPDAPNIYWFLKVFAVLVGGSASTLLDPGVLKSIAEKVGKGVGVQLINKYLRQAATRRVPATVVFQESRLMVRLISVWAMGIGFSILACLALIVLLWRPRDVLPHKPNGIAQYAATLASSHSLQRTLGGAGNLSDSQLEECLGKVAASSHVTTGSVAQAFSIRVNSHEEVSDFSSDGAERPILWWRPLSTRIWFMSLAILIPLTIIAALEVLQRNSDVHDGLLDISSTALLNHSLPSILASLVMISTATMYDAVDFVAATLAPYQALVRGVSAAEYSIFGGLIGNPPLWSTVGAFWSQFGASTVSFCAAVAGSFLTIIASGLYTIDNVSRTSAVNIIAADRFVPHFNISTDGGAGAVFNLMEHNNASYPLLTYDELAFPGIAISSLGQDALNQLNKSESVIFHSTLPAMRASLNCTVVPRDSIKTRLYYYKTTTCPSTYAEFNVSLPASCPRFLDAKNQSINHIQFSYQAQFACSNPGLLQASRGAMIFSTNGIAVGENGGTLGAASNPPGCPSLAFIQGYWLVNNTSTENITAMTCIQGLEEVHADTTLEASGDTVRIKSAPIVDETSRRWLTAINNTYWFTRYGYFDGFNQNGSDADFFYQAVNFGPDGVPADELSGPSNVNRFITATQHVYRKWMAQLISNTMRQDLNNTDAASKPRYVATISNIPIQRLRQNAASKIVLQIFLAIMLVCGIIVYCWRDMRHVLPHCPWSIAGLMSLLAGAEMVDRKIMPPGAEFMNDEELSKVLDGYMFSLGWWNTGQQKRFGIDIGKADVSARRRAWAWARQ